MSLSDWLDRHFGSSKKYENVDYIAANYERPAKDDDLIANHVELKPGWYEVWHFCGKCRKPTHRVPGHFAGHSV
jgi:hypothetical protein